MSDLRTRLIRLAHSNPSLREDILPLVSERVAADENEYTQADLKNFREDVLNPVAIAEGAGIPSEVIAREFLKVLKKVYPSTKVRLS
jgi:hypothetical protein